jgi:heme/copper-type cytochrome/quinol oxidase subunit 4
VLLTIGVFLSLATIAATTGATIALSLSLLPAIATESGTHDRIITLPLTAIVSVLTAIGTLWIIADLKRRMMLGH